MLNVIVLGVIMLSVIMLIVMAPEKHLCLMEEQEREQARRH